MAIAAATILNVRPSGVDTNGGGFVEGASGTNHTLQNAAQYAVTDGVTAGTTTITSASASFGTDVVGNLAYVAGGTGSIVGNWYQITVRVSATQITVDRSTGLTAGTGVTINIGGALATPGQAAAIMTVAGMRTYVMTGTYTMTTTAAGAAGPVTWSTAGIMEGYSVTQGDRAARPVLDAGAQTGFTGFSITGSALQSVISMKFDGQSGATITGFNAGGTRTKFLHCEAVDVDGASSVGFSGGMAVSCKAQNCLTGFNPTGESYILCESEDCTTGFNLGAAAYCDRCLAYGGTTAYLMTATGVEAVQCSVIGATTGFSMGNAGAGAHHCVATGNTTGFTTSGTRACILDACIVWNNTTDVSGTFMITKATVTLTGDPWVNAATDDYRPNATAGAGALLRAADGEGHMSQTNNVDAGAVQHTDPATSGSSINGGLIVIGNHSTIIRGI